jgi:plasmid stabilization system protein ParE
MIVDWVESALDRLANIFVAANPAERDAIEAAALNVNAELAAGPSALGESRSGGRRLWFVDLLAVIFRVVPNKGRVVVLDVARSRRR